MKKLLVYLLLSTILLAGCSSGKDSNSEDTKSTAEKEVSESTDNIVDNTASKDTTEDKTVDSVTIPEVTTVSNPEVSTEPEIRDTTEPEVVSEPEITTTPEITTDTTVNEKEDTVIGKVQLYAGNYFDVRRYGENKPNPYCEIEISNITDTSFDFAIYQVEYTDVANNAEQQRDIIFLQHTAVFIEDGTKAAFYGNDYTLYFTFPNNHGAYPVVTDLQITGFQQVEGTTFVNNGIPGHEFG